MLRWWEEGPVRKGVEDDILRMAGVVEGTPGSRCGEDMIAVGREIGPADGRSMVLRRTSVVRRREEVCMIAC